MMNSHAGWLPGSGFQSNITAKLRNFVEHIMYGEPTIAPAEHGLMVQKMLNGIYASAEKGREIRIN